ncbi:MAG: hypothetical protein LKF88_05345 [Microbacteriaceae bacterium]|nr:hypothetical protein [Microbacteriaceae bacterium]MCI1207004.1 hypothetical protein [Microbacteriaceae bacterium]
MWNDRVSPRDLLLALIISAGLILVSSVIATALAQSLLFWGLGAAACGFALNCWIIRPKRVFIEATAPDENPASESEAPIA